MSTHQIAQLAGQTRQRVEMRTDENLSTEYSLRDALQATVVRESSFAEFRGALEQYRMRLH
jgi:hypothetical protein